MILRSVNLNDYCRLTLTDLGRALLEAERTRRSELLPNSNWATWMKETDGYLRIQLWEAWQLFAIMTDGAILPFETWFLIEEPEGQR